MSDPITAKASGNTFKIHPAGQFIAQCVDTIDLGDKLEEFPGNPPKLVHKCALVFRTGEQNEETGEYIDVAKEFTVSMGDKANLRKFLEQWRGKAYTPEQLDAGVPLHKLTGNHGQITVAHTKTKKGNDFAVLTACVGVMAQLKSHTKDWAGTYTRGEWWDKRKKEYAEEAQKFRAEQAPTTHDDADFGGFPADDDDSLPF